jgi:hypothetical protein
MSRRLILAAFGFCLTPAMAAEMPPRKPGLWDMRMSIDGTKMPPQLAQHCIDAETDKLMSDLGNGMQKEMCQKHEMTKSGDTLVVDSVCNIGGVNTTTRAEISGNFDSAYTVKVQSKREDTPASKKKPGSAEMSMTIAATWAGECKKGQKPGDMIMPGGVKLNVRDMQKLQAGQGAAPAGAPPKKQ